MDFEPLQVAHQYVQLINTGEWERVGELFAEDAVVHGPTGAVLRGRDEIARFYTDRTSRVAPNIWIVSSTTEGNRCLFELGARMSGAPDGPMKTVVDHFTFNEQGQIKRFVFYGRPTDSSWSADPPNRQAE